MSGSKSRVFRIRLKTIATESIERKKSIIADTKNSGTVNSGLGETEVELVGHGYCLCITPTTSLAQKNREREELHFCIAVCRRVSMKKLSFTQNLFLYNCEVLTAAQGKGKNNQSTFS